LPLRRKTFCESRNAPKPKKNSPRWQDECCCVMWRVAWAHPAGAGNEPPWRKSTSKAPCRIAEELERWLTARRDRTTAPAPEATNSTTPGRHRPPTPARLRQIVDARQHGAAHADPADHLPMRPANQRPTRTRNAPLPPRPKHRANPTHRKLQRHPMIFARPGRCSRTDDRLHHSEPLLAVSSSEGEAQPFATTCSPPTAAHTNPEAQMGGA